MQNSINTFQRRKHDRYAIQQDATLRLPEQRGMLSEVPCELMNLSRYGLFFRTSEEGLMNYSKIKVSISFQKSPPILLGIKLLREVQGKKETVDYAGELSFPNDETRRKLHLFLSCLKDDVLMDKRKGQRRGSNIAIHEELRRTDRRKNYGIFSESVSFSKRITAWRNTYYRPAESKRPGRITVDGKELISFASKDYLGIAHDPRLKEAAIKALERYGTTTGSRVLNGTIPLHEELEHTIAEFKGTEAALLFTGGYIGNIAILTALLKKKDDIVFIDEKVHASIIDGCLAGGAKTVIFKHNVVEDLEKKVRRIKPSRSLIIVDGVYSIDGDLGYLPEISQIAKSYEIPLMVDDAHGIGVMGPTGAGTAEHFGLKGEIDLDVGSCGAALAGVGGFVACKKHIRDYLLHFSNGVVFTTNLTPVTMAGILEALKIIKTDPMPRLKLWSRVNQLKQGLRDLGYRISPSESAVMSLLIGNEHDAFDVVEMLFEKGIYVNPFRRPLVRRGEAKIRIAVSAAHTENDISRTIEIFKELKPDLDLKTAVY